MTIRHLKIFAAVAETGKMSAAADLCFITQPTVSQAIRELEEHYGVRLFERFSRKLYITEAGEQLLQYTRQVISQFDILETNMQGFRSGSQLRLGATITVGACLLSSILNDLKEQHPRLQIYSCVANTSLIEQKLLSSELDVALVEGTIQSPSLIAIPVVEDFLVLAMSNTHPLASRSKIHVSELSPYEFVIREKGSGTRRLFEDYMALHGIPFPIALEATCLDAIKNAVLYTGYLSAISVRLVEQEVLNGRIHIVRNLESDWNRSFFLVYHKDKLFSEPMRTLERMMQTYQCPDFLDEKACAVLTAE